MKKLGEEMEAAGRGEKMLELNRRVQADLPLSAAERSAWRQWIGIAPAASSSSSAGKRRKRKKRRKRRTPRTSSRSSCGRVRRRQRQWHTRSAGFSGDVPLRSVSSLVMAGMDLKDRCSGMFNAGIAGDSVPRAVFLSLVIHAHDAPYHGRHAPRRTVSRGVQGNWFFLGDDVVFFYGPLYLKSFVRASA